MNKPTSKTIAQTLKKHQTRILKKAHVVGVGVGEKIKDGKPMGRLCLKVYVEKKVGDEKLSKSDLVPPRLARVETDVEEVGKIKLLAYTRRMRPAPPGVSIGHYKVTAGTLGCLVKDKLTGQTLILSNNHVLANSNAARKGDAIIQPGAADCAVACPLDEKNVKPEIFGNGTPKGTTKPRRDLVVQKTGRTTEFTMGRVRDVSATVKVDYDGGTALFENQILTSAMSQGGDSGSLVMDQRNRAVGLLFAGSEVVTIANPISDVLKSLDVRF